MSEIPKELVGIYTLEKLRLATDIGLYFNGLLSEIMSIVHQIKPKKEEFIKILADFKEAFIPFFDLSKSQADLIPLWGSIAEVDGGNPIINLLYRKFSVIIGFMCDFQKAPNFVEINSGMKENLLRSCEILELFIGKWNPEMKPPEVQAIILKISDSVNRKYNPQEYDFYS